MYIGVDISSVLSSIPTLCTYLTLQTSRLLHSRFLSPHASGVAGTGGSWGSCPRQAGTGGRRKLLPSV